MSRRILVFAAVIAAVWIGEAVYDLNARPDVSAGVSVSALNGGSLEATAVRREHAAHNVVPITATGVTLAAALVCFSPRLARRGDGCWR